MKYGFYLSPCGEKIAYYYFDEEYNAPTLDNGKTIISCNINGWLEACIDGWIYLGE